MKITSCEIFPVKLTLEKPFSIAYMTIDHTINVFIRIHTDEGITGLGCGGHDQEVTGENGQTIEKALRQTAEPLLIGEDPLATAFLTQRIREQMPSEPTALSAVDMALADIAARKAGLPLYAFLGGKLRPVTTSITLGIQPLDETVSQALEYRKKGFRILKIKGGNDVNADIEKIRKIHETVGTQMGLFFDANQGYTIAEAKRCIQTLTRVGAFCIEQPCPSADLSQFSHLRNEACPVMADESVLGPEDAINLIRAGGFQMVNIKLAKAGTIRRALAIDAIAGVSGAPSMMGSMDESALSTAAGLHTMLCAPNCSYADLDGALEFIDDPAGDAVILKDGQLLVHDRPGLGFSLK
jgi:L-alanine-DL-glutamate epimerase-like enolase superfamily enzyme